MTAKTIYYSVALVAFQIATLPSFSYAQSDEAKKILERTAGTKVAGDDALLPRIRERLAAGDRVGAAVIAQEHPNFLNATVKQFALKMSTREESITTPFNDFAAFYIGITRDALDARLLLSGNFHYKAQAGMITKMVDDAVVADDDVARSNTHYETLERMVGARQTNMKDALIRVNGQVLNGDANTPIANPDAAGVLTSRAFLGSHAIMGTNRRPVEFTFRQFLCMKMEDWSDTGASDARVGRDIDRMPAGASLNYLTTCKGCHTGMDGFRGAFARWDLFQNGNGNHLVNSLVNTDGKYNLFQNGVSRKMNGNNTVYPSGFTTTDGTWINNSRGQANADTIGWRGNVSGGTGVNSFGQAIANTKRFSQCMVKHVYESACRKSMDIKSAYVAGMAAAFEAGGYKLGSLFADVVVSEECSK